MAKTDGINAQELQSFVDRIERLEEEMSNLRGDIRQIYAEAKAVGYDPKIIRVVLRLKKLDDDDRRELDELTDTYRTALDV